MHDQTLAPRELPAAAHHRHHAARMLGRFRWWLGAPVVAVAALVLAMAWPPSSRQFTEPYIPLLTGPDGLMTNEFAHFNPDKPGARFSRDWDVTSGSLFIRHGVGWSGVPDARSPNAGSTNGTGSSVFRMTTRRHDFQDFTVSLQVRNLGLISDGRSAPSEIDGIHVFLRWHSPNDLYAVSVNRRDDQVVVKKKSPRTPAGEGEYETLGHTKLPVAYGTWQAFSIRIRDSGRSRVVFTVGHGSRQILSAADSGAKSPVIPDEGAVGLRADNCNFEVKDFQVVRA